MLLSDSIDFCVVSKLGSRGAKGRVGLRLDTLGEAEVDERLLGEERVKLDLVGRGDDLGGLEEGLKLGNRPAEGEESRGPGQRVELGQKRQR